VRGMPAVGYEGHCAATEVDAVIRASPIAIRVVNLNQGAVTNSPIPSVLTPYGRVCFTIQSAIVASALGASVSSIDTYSSGAPVTLVWNM
jgi:hypothetical protein